MKTTPDSFGFFAIDRRASQNGTSQAKRLQESGRSIVKMAEDGCECGGEAGGGRDQGGGGDRRLSTGGDVEVYEGLRYVDGTGSPSGLQLYRLIRPYGLEQARARLERRAGSLGTSGRRSV